MKQTKVSANLQQDFTSAEKSQARSNIGAASSSDLSAEVNRATAAEAAAKTEVVGGTNTTVTSTTGANGQTVYTVSNTLPSNVKTLQTPVNETFNSYSCLTGLRQSANGNVEVDTETIPAATDQADGLMASTDKAKLDGIAAGAEVNVQANWTEADSSVDSYIQNKPQNLVQDANYVHTDNNFTTSLKDKLDGIEAGAQVNVKSDWTATAGTASEILHKPEIAKTNYGASTNTELTSLVLNADYPDGSVQVKADGTGMGMLVSGPYATLLDSGVNGIGDATHPVYIDSNGVFQQGSAGQTYSVFTTTTDGLAPKANGTGDTGKYLKGDGTWDTPTDTTYNVFNNSTNGLVPAPTTGANKYLRDDGTWQYPITGNFGDADHMSYLTQGSSGLIYVQRGKRIHWSFQFNDPSLEITAADITNGYVEFVFVLGDAGLKIAETGNMICMKGYDIQMGNALNGKQMSFYIAGHGTKSPRMLMDTGFTTFTESTVNNYDWKAFKAIGLTANNNLAELDAVLRVPLSGTETAGDTFSIPGRINVCIFGTAGNDT